MGERIILHCDLNSFYASVELLDKPALWEVPVAVCGDPRTRHGIIPVSYTHLDVYKRQALIFSTATS